MRGVAGTYRLIFRGVQTRPDCVERERGGDPRRRSRGSPASAPARSASRQDGAAAGTFLITFVDALGGTDQPLLRTDTTALTGGTPLQQFRITGFGQGADRLIGGAPQPGGVTFEEVETLELTLGSGNTRFTVETTPAGTLTRIDTGPGSDAVAIKRLQGHTFVDLGADSDTLTVHDGAQSVAQLLGLLTVSGDVPQADVLTLAKGSPSEGTSVASVDEIQRVTIDATAGEFTLTYTPAIAATLIQGRAAPATNEVQTLKVAATGGTYTLSLDVDGNGIIGAGETTDPIAWDAPAMALDGALEALLGSGTVSVTLAGGTYTITFQGSRAATDVPQIVPNGATTAPIAHNALAGVVDGALESAALVGAGNVEVSKAGRSYRIVFVGGARRARHRAACRPTPPA